MANGSQAAEELVKKYQGAFTNRAASVLGDRGRAVVVVQDTFVAAFNGLDKFRGESKFFTWLYRIFNNRLLGERKAVTVAARREVSFEGESATRSGDPESQDPARPREADWIDQIEQAVTLGRQHNPEKDHEARDRLVEVTKDIHECLPEQTERVFYLKMAGLSTSEIAHVLRTSDANVRNHVKRGRAVLKQKRDERS
jgi:RNA polymerase sigma factor (sigma-70 family)